MPDVKIITTSDGSHSLLNVTLNETYHSVHGAVQESQHVFIRHGLECWLERNKKREIRILEVGFGTGLNVLLTLLHSVSKGSKIYYESWEAFPLAPDVIAQLNYPEVHGGGEWFTKIHEGPWNQSIAITPAFRLKKYEGDVLAGGFEGLFDIIYYDAFAPAKQGEMWTLGQLRNVTNTLGPGGLWVTYCAKGQVKRDIKSLGLTLETLPGPPGKKEMIRASR